MRAATGFLLFLSAFASVEEVPASWFVALAISAAAGGFLADLFAPRLPETLREEFIVVGCTIAAGGDPRLHRVLLTRFIFAPTAVRPPSSGGSRSRA